MCCRVSEALDYGPESWKKTLHVKISIFVLVINVSTMINCVVKTSCVCPFIFIVGLMNSIELVKRFGDCLLDCLRSR